MTLNLKWVWELTPNQVFQKNVFVPPTTSRQLRVWEAQERKPFLGAKLPLEGTGLTYQLALTRKGKTEDTKALREALPDLPDSGDYRSGVLVFDANDRIVGSFRMSGANAGQPLKMVIDPAYRQQGLAEKIAALWWSNVKHTYRTEGRQPMTWVVVQLMLNAYKTVVQKAIADGLPVPAQVRAEVTTQSEANQVLQRAKAVDPNAK